MWRANQPCFPELPVDFKPWNLNHTMSWLTVFASSQAHPTGETHKDTLKVRLDRRVKRAKIVRSGCATPAA